MLFFFSSRRRHTRCALVTGVQTCALPIWLLDDVKAGRFDVIVLDSLTRLSRHPADLHPLHRLLDFIGIKLVTVDVGDISLMHVGILATMSGLSLEATARETHRNQEGEVLRGKVMGGRRYGYRAVRAFDESRSEEQTSELQSLLPISHDVF